MRIIVAGLIVAGFGIQAGIIAAADDTNSDRPTVSHREMMRDCMTREKAANNAASQDGLKRLCREKIKSYDNHPSVTTPPPNNPGS